MNARNRNVTAIAIAIAVVALYNSAHAQAGSPFDKVRKVLEKVERVVAVQGVPYQQGSGPYPQPYPQPCPQPCPGGNPVPLPAPMPMPTPAPQPVLDAYFLGVQTSTVPVTQTGAPPSGPQVLVVPGYGQEVYGQRVNSIVPNSPAFHAGLEAGDIIINANGYAMDTADHLRTAIADSQGYLEMQVLDSRSGQLVWVIAEPEGQSAPMMAVGPSTNGSDPLVHALPPKTVQGGDRQNFNAQPPSLQTLGDRRPPLRRR